MAKPLSFKDMMNVEYRPGEDELTNYRVQRRKRTYSGNEDLETEALTMQQRLARSRMLKRYKNKIKLGRERAKRRMASKEKLEKRAMKQARMMIFKKLAKKDKQELGYAARANIEKRMSTPAIKKRINVLAKRIFKDVRKKEVARKKG